MLISPCGKRVGTPADIGAGTKVFWFFSSEKNTSCLASGTTRVDLNAGWYDIYARDEDGFHEIHINTMQGFWSLLRSWLRPHRGTSQEKLPIYLGSFEFVHNVRKRGKQLLGALVAALVA